MKKLFLTLIICLFASSVQAETTYIIISLATHETISIDNKSGKKISAIIHVQEILERVKDYTGIYVDVGDLKITVFETRGDFNIFLAQNFPKYIGVVAIYDTVHNVIYTFPHITPRIMAHELTHVLVTRAHIKVAKGHLEDLPMDVDRHVNLGWIF